jgi:hypothetical protein
VLANSDSLVNAPDDDVIKGASVLVAALSDAPTPINNKSPVLPVGTVTDAVVAVTDAPAPDAVPTSVIAIDYIVTVWVTVSWSPEADNVAVAESNVSCNKMPVAPVKVSNVPILAIVTGNESEPFAVYDPVSVYVVALVVCA